MITKFYSLIGHSESHKVAEYDVASCFRSDANWTSILAIIAKIVPRAVSYKQLSSQTATMCAACAGRTKSKDYLVYENKTIFDFRLFNY